MSTNANPQASTKIDHAGESQPPECSGPAARHLLPHHLEWLKRSGLTEETCRLLGIYSTTDPHEIARLLNWHDDGATERATSLGPCIVFPYLGMVGFAKLRPDNPRRLGPVPTKKLYSDAFGHNYAHQDPVDERKPIKYESPRDAGTHVYAPEVLCPGLLDAEQMLYITEGEKKAALGCQEGLPTVSIPGVWNAHNVDAGEEAQDWGGQEFVLHPEISRYAMPGRDCCILFDAPDMEEKPQVVRAAVRLAKMLADHGAVPSVGYIENVCGDKTGLDDL